MIPKVVKLQRIAQWIVSHKSVHVMEMVFVSQNLVRTIYPVFKIVVAEIISVNINLERQLTIVHKTVGYVEMVIVIILKVAARVKPIVAHVK